MAYRQRDVKGYRAINRRWLNNECDKWSQPAANPNIHDQKAVQLAMMGRHSLARHIHTGSLQILVHVIQ